MANNEHEEETVIIWATLWEERKWIMRGELKRYEKGGIGENSERRFITVFCKGMEECHHINDVGDRGWWRSIIVHASRQRTWWWCWWWWYAPIINRDEEGIQGHHGEKEMAKWKYLQISSDFVEIGRWSLWRVSKRNKWKKNNTDIICTNKSYSPLIARNNVRVQFRNRRGIQEHMWSVVSTCKSHFLFLIILFTFLSISTLFSR